MTIMTFGKVISFNLFSLYYSTFWNAVELFFSNVSLQIVHLIDFYNTFAYCTIKKYLEDN